MSPSPCAELCRAYIQKNGLKFGIFSAPKWTEISFFQYKFGSFCLISSVFDVFSKKKSLFELGNLKFSVISCFKFESNFALFLVTEK